MAQESGVNVVEASRPFKDPPPETAKVKWRRRSILLSFWMVALLLGLPMWWKTTTVYRAELPVEEMTQWADGKKCTPTFPLRIGIDASSLPKADAQRFFQETQNLLESSNLPSHRFYLKQWNPKKSNSKLSLKVELSTSSGATNPSASIQPNTNVLQISYGTSSSLDDLAAYVSQQLIAIYAEENAIFSQLSTASLNEKSLKALSSDVAESVRRRTTRTFKYAANYHLTFSLFTPEGYPASWEIEKALRKTFIPVVEALSAVANFSIETQVQPYATFASSIQPQYKHNGRTWMLKREDLGGFINSAEWPLSPSIGSGPTVNFVLYVPSSSESPLLVESSTSNSWLVPHWGVVAIHNPVRERGSSNPVSLTEADLQPSMVTFSNQLLSLLGLPVTPSESFPLRLATLSRVRAASLFLSASSTLGSLARLVSQLPSISIPDSVADNVAQTTDNLELYCTSFNLGNFQQALTSAKSAEAHAEKAFFEKSMVGQVYFPDEHKIAVYLPLLGPVAVPLIVAVLAEIKPLVQKLRNRP